MGRLDFSIPLDLRKLVITLVALAIFAKAANGECCGNLVLTLENAASANQGPRAGNYEIQAETVNGRNVWKRDDGKYVVWFNSDTGYWTIGSSLGSGGGLFAPSQFECPNEVGSQWSYYEVGSSNTIIGAGNDVSVKCPDPCPIGYVLNMDQFGSLPDSGQLGYQKYIESIDDCATLCNAEQYCCAFEYSDSQKRCYMNIDCNPTRPAYNSYNYCTKEAGKVDCVTISSDKHKPCVFPVLWKGESHDKCIKQESTGKTWCATELKDNGKYKTWGHCGDSCPREGYLPPPPSIPTTRCLYPGFEKDEFCDDVNNTPECNYDNGACCGDNVLTTYCVACKCLGSACSLDRTEDKNIGYGVENFQPSDRADGDVLTGWTDNFLIKHFIQPEAFDIIKQNLEPLTGFDRIDYAKACQDTVNGLRESCKCELEVDIHTGLRWNESEMLKRFQNSNRHTDTYLYKGKTYDVYTTKEKMHIFKIYMNKAEAGESYFTTDFVTFSVPRKRCGGSYNFGDKVEHLGAQPT